MSGTTTHDARHPTRGRVAVAGASGWIGQHLRRHLEASGRRVVMIGRAPTNDASWGDPDALRRAVDGAELLLNLAGRSVSCRYSRRNADQILDSRVRTTAELGRAVAAAADPPSLWVNASTATIYRDARDRPMDEVHGELGAGFSVEVARAWERELFGAPVGSRRVALRMSIVLGPGGGAVNPFINLARTGLGGPMGDGGQMFSWVHVDDVGRAVDHLLDHPEVEGPVNLAAPEVVTNAELMRLVRLATGVRRGLPEPAWLLEAGARIIRTEAELVLKSRWIDSRVLRESGFVVEHPSLERTLRAIVAASPQGLLPVALG